MSALSLLPSIHDRLDPIAAMLRWWTTQMASLVPEGRPRLISVEALEAQRRVPGSVLIELGETDAFHARVALPKGGPEQHRKALQLRLADLSPVDPQALEMVAIAMEPSANGSIYAIAMARRDQLKALETLAGRKGARKVAFQAGPQSEAPLASTAVRQRRRRSVVIDAALACLVALGASVAIQFWAQRLEQETAALNAAERSLRRAVVAGEASAKEARLAADLVDQGVLKRRAGAAFETLAQISAATPNTAWWTAYRWRPDSITIAGQSPDATGAIKYLASKSANWRIEIGGPINAATAGGAQAFEVRLQPKYGPQR